MKKRLNLILVAAIILLTLFYIIFAYVFPKSLDIPSISSESGTMSAHFMDVGQGDSILLVCDGQAALIDSGTEEYADTVVCYLQNQGVSRLSLVGATHPHSDHIGGMNRILHTFPVDRFILPDATNNTTSFENMLLALDEEKIPTEYAYKGSSYTLGGAELSVLSPPKGYQADDLNNDSLVILVEYQGVRILLCGDAGKEMELKMISDGLTPVDVLKVGHHGSDDASCQNFLATTTPIAAVISVGEGNSYGHPSEKRAGAPHWYRSGRIPHRPAGGHCRYRSGGRFSCGIPSDDRLYCVDRIEEGVYVLTDENGRETAASGLPMCARPGDSVRFLNGRWEICKEETEARRKRIGLLLEKITKRKK